MITNIKEYLGATVNTFENGWFIGFLTDEVILDTLDKLEGYKLDSKEEKILEIRAFDKEKELKLFRSDVGRKFFFRQIDDVENTDDSFDEVHMLDVNMEKQIEKTNGKNIITSTGGGKYNLPLHNVNDSKIRIRYYISKNIKTGLVCIKDWRLVELLEGK